MKSVVQIIYEVDLNEINRLPIGYTVMQKDTQTGARRVLSAHVDFFAANMQRYKYFIFDAPPLPKLNEQLITGGANV